MPRLFAAGAVALLALLAAAPAALAQERPPLTPMACGDVVGPRVGARAPADGGRPKTRLYVGGGAGAVAGRYADPKLVDDDFSGVTTELHAGVAVTRWLGVGLEFSTFYDEVTRSVAGSFSYDGERARAAAAAAPGPGLGVARAAVDCPNCGAAPAGGLVVRQALHLHTFGPRLDFAPDPARGVFASVTSGMSFTQELTERAGFVANARAGYRLALTRQVGVALEGGGSAHRFSSSLAAFAFGGVQLQLRI